MPVACAPVLSCSELTLWPSGSPPWFVASLQERPSSSPLLASPQKCTLYFCHLYATVNTSPSENSPAADKYVLLRKKEQPSTAWFEKGLFPHSLLNPSLLSQFMVSLLLRVLLFHTLTKHSFLLGQPSLKYRSIYPPPAIPNFQISENQGIDFGGFLAFYKFDARTHLVTKPDKLK